MASDDSVIKNKDLDRMWRVAVMTKFELMSQHLLGGAEENQNLIQGSRSTSQLLNRDLSNTNKRPLLLDPNVQYLLCIFIFQAVNFLQQYLLQYKLKHVDPLKSLLRNGKECVLRGLI